MGLTDTTVMLHRNFGFSTIVYAAKMSLRLAKVRSLTDEHLPRVTSQLYQQKVGLVSSKLRDTCQVAEGADQTLLCFISV